MLNKKKEEKMTSREETVQIFHAFTNSQYAYV